jgi:hypothetical protein
MEGWRKPPSFVLTVYVLIAFLLFVSLSSTTSFCHNKRNKRMIEGDKVDFAERGMKII